MRSVGRGRNLWGGGGQVVYYESSPVRKPRKVMVMAVQLTIPYETLVELIDQLPEAEQSELLDRLLQRRQRPRTADQWIRDFHASILSVEINEEPSIRREDWYDDDGR